MLLGNTHHPFLPRPGKLSRLYSGGGRTVLPESTDPTELKVVGSAGTGSTPDAYGAPYKEEHKRN